MSRRGLRRLAVVLLPLLLAGCAASPAPAPTPAAAPSPYTPGPGLTTLADEGYTQGPAAWVPLPEAVTITQHVDQANVLAASFPATEGGRIAQVLRAQLPAAGWVVVADADDAILFERPGWEGAFTASPRASAVTIRAVPPQ